MHPQVKQLRLEREREKAMREQELEMLQREKEAEHFKTWEEQEDNFHLQQAKLRYVGRPARCCLHLPLPTASFWAQTHRALSAPGPLYMLFALLGAFCPGWFPLPFRFPPIAASGGPSLTPFLVPTPAVCAASCSLPSLSLSLTSPLVSPIESHAKETSA